MSEIKARPTLYKGIQMRSRLEADFAASLDRDGLVWKYEPTCFAGDEGQWLPDFQLEIVSPYHHYIELKPASLLEKQGDEGWYEIVARVDAILGRMAVAWHSEPDAYLDLTFWSYGASEEVRSIYGRRYHPWLMSGHDEFSSIWPGMGQLDFLQNNKSEPAVIAEIASHWRGLVGPMAAHAWPGNLRDGVLRIYVDSEEWAARAREREERLVQVLNLVLDGKPVCGIDVRLDGIAAVGYKPPPASEPESS